MDRSSLLYLILFLVSCTPQDNVEIFSAEGYAPVYMSLQGLDEIKYTNPRPTGKAGKIYAYGQYLFQNEINEGIHVIDNSNPKQPVKKGFLKIPLSGEIAVQGNHLYSNNYSSLVVFDISDSNNPRLVKKIEDVFPPVNQQYPPFTNVRFQCPDPSKGVVAGWVLTSLENAKCRR